MQKTPSIAPNPPGLWGCFIKAHLLAGVPLPTLMVDFLDWGGIGDFRHLTSPPISRLVSTSPFCSFSTLGNFQTMIYTPKDAPFKTTPKSQEGLITPILMFSPRNAKRFFPKSGFWGSGNNVLIFSYSFR